MKIATADLIGAALDWAVAICESSDGRVVRVSEFGFIERANGTHTDTLFHRVAYSTDWAQGGLIIEREGIEIVRCYSDGNPRKGVDSWNAKIAFVNGILRLSDLFNYANTPLIAAMRCYVASVLGDTVDVPDEIAKRLIRSTVSLYLSFRPRTHFNEYICRCQQEFYERAIHNPFIKFLNKNALHGCPYMRI
jgi:hypothetical protein